MFKWIDNFLKPYQVATSDMSTFGKIVALEARIKKLEEENVELTNCLYETMQSIDEVNIKIDKIHPVIYNINKKE
jgi:uncharacterized coiled-coil DUF342 family protein